MWCSACATQQDQECYRTASLRARQKEVLSVMEPCLRAECLSQVTPQVALQVTVALVELHSQICTCRLALADLHSQCGTQSSSIWHAECSRTHSAALLSLLLLECHGSPEALSKIHHFCSLCHQAAQIFESFFQRSAASKFIFAALHMLPVA